MKSFKRHFIASLALLAILSLSGCNTQKGSASVAFAQSTPSISIPKDSLEVTQALQTTFRAISSQVLPAVVEVDVTETTTVQTYNPFEYFFGFGNGGSGTKEYEQQGLGSGFIVRHIGNKYYVLTNNHVAGNASKISIKLHDEREFKGTLVGTDERIDIALIYFECDDNSIPVATLGNSNDVQTGDICLALGSPMGYFASVTQGIVSATGRSGSGIGSISDFIQTDAAINQGNSGGPLVNIYGEVIGINTWIVSQSGGSQGLGFSIPINNVKDAIDQFITTGKIEYGWLGVQVSDLDKSEKSNFGIGNETGALVTEIYLDSPAFKGGIIPGDYIIEINGEPVKSKDTLVRIIGNIKAGETANFKVIRAGKKIDLKVKIEARDENVTNSTNMLWPGFTPQELTDTVKKQLGNKNLEGVLVAGIQSKTPASALRLQNGDVITAVNDVKVKNLKEFYEALDLSGKKEIWFDIYSNGHTITTSKFKL